MSILKRQKRTKFGIPIEVKNFPISRGLSGEKRNNWLYRLGYPPDEIGLKNICLKPKAVELKEKQLNLI